MGCLKEQPSPCRAVPPLMRLKGGTQVGTVAGKLRPLLLAGSMIFKTSHCLRILIGRKEVPNTQGFLKHLWFWSSTIWSLTVLESRDTGCYSNQGSRAAGYEGRHLTESHVALGTMKLENVGFQIRTGKITDLSSPGKVHCAWSCSPGRLAWWKEGVH